MVAEKSEGPLFLHQGLFCLSVPLSSSRDLSSRCLVCVCHSSCWSSFLKRAIRTCWRSINTKLSAWHGRIVSSLKWAGLFATLWEKCMEGFLEAAVIVIENGSSGTGGNVQEIVGQHYTLHLPEAHKCYKYFSSLHKLFIDDKHSPCCHLRTGPLMTSRNLPSLPKLVHTKRNSDPTIRCSVARGQDFIQISFSIQLSHLLILWPSFLFQLCYLPNQD